MGIRKILYPVHKYVGVIIGVVLALIGLSGSLLVFDHALDEAVTPALRNVSHQASGDLQGLLLAAEQVVAPGVLASRIDFPRQPGSPYMVGFRGPEPERRRIEVSVDPLNHDVLAVREWGEYPMSWLYDFHYTLLAGDLGRNIVGFVGIGLLFFCLSGLYLAWPRHGRWRYVMRVARGAGSRRVFWDIHRVAGLLALPALFVCALTGIAMVFYTQTNAVVNSVTEVRDVPSCSVVPAGRRLPLDDLVRRAEAHWPQAQIKRVFLPQKATDCVRLAVNLPDERWSNHSASSLWLDPYRGEVAEAWAAPQQPLGNQVLAWIFPLHNADILGLPGRWVLLFSGLAPVLLFATGSYLWWSRRLG